MSLRLSIIIPCYNCSRTLEEAFRSIYKQNLAVGTFEIIMVDDGSKDRTRNLIEKLAAEQKEVKLIFHKKNKGGGAARNTGINEAKGKFIYCLDSDNFFASDNSLNSMMNFLENHNADGVAFHERRFFTGNDSASYKSKWNSILDRCIEIGDLFLEDNILLDNFLFTKESYMKTAGFPTQHGFDTQGFEVRYLSAGNKVLVCPDSVFYHRQMPRTSSYFEREYDSGNFSKNYYFIIEEIFDRLTHEAQKVVIDYDIFKRSSIQDNLLNEMKKLHAKHLLLITPEDETKILTHPAFKPYSIYVDSVKAYLSGNFADAKTLLEKAAAAGLRAKIADYHMLRCSLGISGIPENHINKEADRLAPESLRTDKKTLYRVHNRIPLINKLIKFLMAWKRKNQK